MPFLNGNQNTIGDILNISGVSLTNSSGISGSGGGNIINHHSGLLNTSGLNNSSSGGGIISNINPSNIGNIYHHTFQMNKDICQVSDNTLNALFEEYKDPNEDAILIDGIERLCCDLGYKPDDFAILCLAWQLDASQMCQFTKSEFIHGLQNLNADSIVGLKKRLEQIIEKTKYDKEMFKLLYRFTFK